MLPSLGLFGSALALIATAWLTAAGWVFVWPGASARRWMVFATACVFAVLLAIGTLYVAVKPLSGAGISGISGVAGGPGTMSGTDMVAHLAVRFYVAFAVVILVEVGVCALLTAFARKTT